MRPTGPQASCRPGRSRPKSGSKKPSGNARRVQAGVLGNAVNRSRAGAGSGPRRLVSGLRRVFLENLTEGPAKALGVGCGEDQRRPQLDYVVIRAIGTGENSLLAQAIHHVGSLI